MSILKLPCKVRIKSRGEIERTLDKYSQHKSSGIYFSYYMFEECGKDATVVSATSFGSYILKADSWVWHPDWFTVLGDDSFTEEDDAIIKELTQMLEHHLEMQELRETVELLYYLNKKGVRT